MSSPENPPLITRRKFLGLALGALVLEHQLPSGLFNPREAGAQQSERERLRERLEFFERSDGGLHFPDPTLEFYRYPEGYGIDPVMRQAFEAWGEAKGLGKPISTSYQNGSSFEQAFQKLVIQVTTNGDGEITQISGVNIFDLMSKQGRDPEFAALYGIPPLNLSANSTPEDRMDLLDQNPTISEFITQDPLWLEKYGPPRAYANGILRMANACFGIEEDGTVGIFSGGNIVKEKTDGKIIPTDALVAELSERYHMHNFPGEFGLQLIEEVAQSGRLPENIIGSPLFVQEYHKVLDMLYEKYPDYYQYITDHIYQIKEQRRGGRVGVDTSTRVFHASFLDHELWISLDGKIDGFRREAGGFVHEARHIETHLNGYKSNGIYGEIDAAKKELEFYKKAKGHPSWIAQVEDLLANIDDPRRQWWH